MNLDMLSAERKTAIINILIAAKTEYVFRSLLVLGEDPSTIDYDNISIPEDVIEDERKSYEIVIKNIAIIKKLENM